jgi:hypothetical protein
MAKKKKKKKALSIRSTKLKQKKHNKRKLKLVKSKPEPATNFQYSPAFAEIEAPTGFRPVSMSQAMMEYAQPVMDRIEIDNIQEANIALEIATLLWNYTIMLEGGKENKKIKKEIVEKIKTIFVINKGEASDFLDQMTERKKYLFPQDIQPKSGTTMFIKKEVSHLITDFNYNKLDVSDILLEPDEQDKELIDIINQMDKYISENVDYEMWEDHYFSMEESCKDRFEKWLIAKGLSEYSDTFPFYIDVYLNFIYRYLHDDIVTLKSVPPIYFEEFFFDHILRKVVAEPHEYVNWPPAMKLFYRFLYEKGYLADPESITNRISKFEPSFIEILREKFS